jgi:hypothetical protein
MIDQVAKKVQTRLWDAFRNGHLAGCGGYPDRRLQHRFSDIAVFI